MVENGELRCPNCNAEVDPDVNEWMMRDGETRRFQCDEYEVGPYPPMKRHGMAAWRRLYELLDADCGHDISECRGIDVRIRLLTVDDLEVWVSSQGRIWTAWTVELTATNGGTFRRPRLGIRRGGRTGLRPDNRRNRVLAGLERIRRIARQRSDGPKNNPPLYDLNKTHDFSSPPIASLCVAACVCRPVR